MEVIIEEIAYAPDHTGLIWQLGDVPALPWNESIDYARNLRLGGFDDWRLPTDKELEALIDRTNHNPAMRSDAPWRDSSYYWSSTTYEYNKSFAWYVSSDGGCVEYSNKTDIIHVRCVRGGL